MVSRIANALEVHAVHAYWYHLYLEYNAPLDQHSIEEFNETDMTGYIKFKSVCADGKTDLAIQQSMSSDSARDGRRGWRARSSWDSSERTSPTCIYGSVVAISQCSTAQQLV
jgi:hypothetical protein